ncbi:MAG: TonB family protein [Cytophagales bacterium]|nr:TonB family protein [Cytophagales bacterium]
MKAFSPLTFFVFSLLVLSCGKSKETTTHAGPGVATPAPAAAPIAGPPVLPPPPPQVIHSSPGRPVPAVPPAAPDATGARTKAPSGTIPPDFEALYRELDKPVQSFSLPAGKDTLLTCREGTTLQIPAHAFVSASTGEPVTGPVAFRVKEYYAIGDALLANLSTMTKTEPLETGGMVYLEAVAGGEPCALREGASVRIGFPCREKKEGMQLFNGRREKGTMRWDAAAQPAPDAPEGPAEETIFMVVEQMPEFKGGYGKLKEYVARKLRYPAGAARRNVQGTVFVGFEVSRNGEIENTQVLKGVDPALDAEALRLTNGMPPWNPGRQTGKTVRVRYSLPIRFTLGEGIPMTNDTAYADEISRKMEGPEPERPTLSEVSRYLFSTSRLGWINCDRFWRYDGPSTDYVVTTGNARQVDVKIVFDNMNVIMTGVRQNGRYHFGKVPVGQKITVVALKRGNDAYYLAVQQEQVTEGKAPELAFEPVTMQKLKAEMTKLGRR